MKTLRLLNLVMAALLLPYYANANSNTQDREPWQNHQVFSINKQAAYVTFFPFQSTYAALNSIKKHSDKSHNFEKQPFNDDNWSHVQVQGNWESQGFVKPVSKEYFITLSAVLREPEGLLSADRKTSAPISLYKKLVPEQIHHYVRPQENANKTEVRWIVLKNAQGAGLIAVGDQRLNASAWPYKQSDIDFIVGKNGSASASASELVPVTTKRGAEVVIPLGAV